MKRHDEHFKKQFDQDTNRMEHEITYIKNYLSKL